MPETACVWSVEVGVTFRVYSKYDGRRVFCSGSSIFVGFFFMFFIRTGVLGVTWIEVADILTPTHRFTWQTMRTMKMFGFECVARVSDSLVATWSLVGHQCRRHYARRLIASWIEIFWPWGFGRRPYYKMWCKVQSAEPRIYCSTFFSVDFWNEKQEKLSIQHLFRKFSVVSKREDEPKKKKYWNSIPTWCTRIHSFSMAWTTTV